MERAGIAELPVIRHWPCLRRSGCRRSELARERFCCEAGSRASSLLRKRRGCRLTPDLELAQDKLPLPSGRGLGRGLRTSPTPLPTLTPLPLPNPLPEGRGDRLERAGIAELPVIRHWPCLRRSCRLTLDLELAQDRLPLPSGRGLGRGLRTSPALRRIA